MFSLFKLLCKYQYQLGRLLNIVNGCLLISLFQCEEMFSCSVQSSLETYFQSHVQVQFSSVCLSTCVLESAGWKMLGAKALPGDPVRKLQSSFSASPAPQACKGPWKDSGISPWQHLLWGSSGVLGCSFLSLTHKAGLKGYGAPWGRLLVSISPPPVPCRELGSAGTQGPQMSYRLSWLHWKGTTLSAERRKTWKCPGWVLLCWWGEICYNYISWKLTHFKKPKTKESCPFGICLMPVDLSSAPTGQWDG